MAHSTLEEDDRQVVQSWE
ncbi:unnamed protein product [Victoria cruziana]